MYFRIKSNDLNGVLAFCKFCFLQQTGLKRVYGHQWPTWLFCHWNVSWQIHWITMKSWRMLAASPPQATNGKIKRYFYACHGHWMTINTTVINSMMQPLKVQIVVLFVTMCRLCIQFELTCYILIYQERALPDDVTLRSSFRMTLCFFSQIPLNKWGDCICYIVLMSVWTQPNW